MAAILVLSPLTDRGRALIARLEEETGERPAMVNHGTADRIYHLDENTLWAIEAMLGHIDPDWREHVARSTREGAPRFSRVLSDPSPNPRDAVSG